MVEDEGPRAWARVQRGEPGAEWKHLTLACAATAGSREQVHFGDGTANVNLHVLCARPCDKQTRDAY